MWQHHTTSYKMVEHNGFNGCVFFHDTFSTKAQVLRKLFHLSHGSATTTRDRRRTILVQNKVWRSPQMVGPFENWTFSWKPQVENCIYKYEYISISQPSSINKWIPNNIDMQHARNSHDHRCATGYSNSLPKLVRGTGDNRCTGMDSPVSVDSSHTAAPRKSSKSQGTFNIWIGPTGNKRSWWGLDPRKQWVGVVGAWQYGPKAGGDHHLRCTFHRSSNVDMVAFSGSSVNLTTPKHKTIVRKQRTTLRIPSTLSDSTGCRSIG